MYHKRTKQLVEVCPQCCKSIASSDNRLVQDTCGHPKCRICLIQESSGCLLCIAANRTSFPPKEPLINKTSVSIQTAEGKASNVPEIQHRKSVITSVATQLAEEKQPEVKQSISVSPPPSPSPVDNETCHVIKQSLKKDILFPTDIVKRSTDNFYHLKRVFSQRFFNEDKKHKACETEENWTTKTTDVENDKLKEDTSDQSTNWKIPNHIKVQYYCSVHKVTFQEKHNIIRHHMSCSLVSHAGEGNTEPFFSCDICGKSYKLLGKLNRHKKVHTKVTKFKCETCGKCLPDTYSLQVHERTHLQLKPYTCQYCDKKFASLHNYKRHERKHKDDKRFICNDCGFKTLTKHELTRHSVTHTNLKPFTCSLCGSKFALKRTLVRHMKTHDSHPVMVECQYCDSSFKRKDNLERHIKNSHSDLKMEETDKATTGS